MGGIGWRGWIGGMALLVISCNNAPPDNPKDYAAKIQAVRSAKDAQFAATDDPIPKASHATFLPLAYFPIDPDYNVPAQLKPTADLTVVQIPTSVGEADPFR